MAAYMDRVDISFAAVQMNQDLHFRASMYGLGAWLFFISYAVCEVPSNLLLVRFGARRWLFLVEGLPPIARSALFWRYLPDTPAEAGWLNEAERGWLEGRLAESRLGATRSTTTGADVVAVVCDVRVW